MSFLASRAKGVVTSREGECAKRSARSLVARDSGVCAPDAVG